MERMSGVFQIEVAPPSPTEQTIGIIALPPAGDAGLVKFSFVTLYLATDFEDTGVRVAIGRPEAWRIVDDQPVLVGRKVDFEIHPDDEVASIVRPAGVGTIPIAAAVEYSTHQQMTQGGAEHFEVLPNSTLVIALPRTGTAAFGSAFISLATDFHPAAVRLAIGRPGAWRVDENLPVPVGKRAFRTINADDEVISIVYGPGDVPVAALLEYEQLAVPG
jgi:hypothetical protein